jgi:predicted nucleic acid-binding protein
MTHPILPDTDVLVDYLRGRKNAVTLIQSCADRIILSSIAVASFTPA